MVAIVDSGPSAPAIYQDWLGSLPGFGAGDIQNNPIVTIEGAWLDEFTPDKGAPEPETWVLMTIGMAAVGANLRNRRSAVALGAPSVSTGRSA